MLRNNISKPPAQIWSHLWVKRQLSRVARWSHGRASGRGTPKPLLRLFYWGNASTSGSLTAGLKTNPIWHSRQLTLPQQGQVAVREITSTQNSLSSMDTCAQPEGQHPAAPWSTSWPGRRRSLLLLSWAVLKPDGKDKKYTSICLWSWFLTSQKAKLPPKGEAEDDKYFLYISGLPGQEKGTLLLSGALWSLISLPKQELFSQSTLRINVRMVWTLKPKYSWEKNQTWGI